MNTKMRKRRDDVQVFTACALLSNPGAGAWGAVLRCRGVEKCLSGRSPDARTTNNRMAAEAVVQALEALRWPCRVTLTTDSTYVRNYGARISAGNPPEYRVNADLWARVETAAAGHEIDWMWVRARSGDAGNETAHALAAAVFEDDESTRRMLGWFHHQGRTARRPQAGQ